MFAPPKKKIKFDNTPVSNYETFLYANNSMNRLNLAHTFKMSFRIRKGNGYILSQEYLNCFQQNIKIYTEQIAQE